MALPSTLITGSLLTFFSGFLFLPFLSLEEPLTGRKKLDILLDQYSPRVYFCNHVSWRMLKHVSN